MKFILLSCLYLSAFYMPDNVVAQLSDGPLLQPAELSSDTPNLEFDLVLSEGEHHTVAATAFNTRLLGGTLPGPTVRVKKGDWLYINFSNDLDAQPNTNTAENSFSYPDSTNLHFHGAHVSGDRPGDDTTIIVDAGESFRYEVFFPDFHMGGTHWIHPHRHGSGTLQVGGGTAQVMIVEDAPGDVPPEVESAEEVILMVQLFDEAQMDTTKQRSRDGLFNLNSEVGNDFTLVNGQYNPTLEITAGEWQRWRVVFGSWDRNPLDLAMETGGVCEMNLLAKDGIYINDYPRPLTFYPISTAGRADIMVRCSATGSFTVTDFLGDLFTLNVVAPPGGNGAIDVSTPPTSGFDFPRPTYLNDLQGMTPTPGCSCETVLSNNQMNGLSYDPDVFLHKVAVGSLVERTIEGVAQHPYHQHVYPFQLQEFFGIRGDDAEYHKLGDYHDTIMLRTSNEVKIRYEANNFHGRMAVHCHRLTHSDVGMLSFEDVVDPSTGGVCECSPRTGAVGFTRAPTQAPVAPTVAPVNPTVAPVAPTVAPVNPTVAPVAPTVAPVNPTAAPVNPTVAPVAPTVAPVNPTVAPVNPTVAPVEPTVAPVNPTAPPVPNPTEAPVPNPTEAPVPSPTVAPVNPTTAPVTAPSDSCVDSPLRAIIDGRNRDCAWIVQNGYCNRNRYSSHCPSSCGVCPQCTDSRASFRFQRQSRTCRYIGNNSNLCSRAGISETCPETCGTCGLLV